MRIRILIIVVCLLLVISFSTCKKSVKGLTQITVTLDWTPNTNHTGLYVALEKGLFANEGLDVKIVQPGQGYTDQIVATGNSEFGISYQENVTRARAEGMPLVSIAAIIQHNTSGFASLASSKINSPKDFEGKKYGSWDSPSELAVLKAVMQKAGADFDKVTVVSGVTDFFSTIGRDADFEWIFEGWDGTEAKLRNLQINYLPLRELEPALDYYTPVIITTENLIKSYPELIKSFMKAVSAGYEFAMEQPNEAAQILLKHAPELKPELVIESQKYLSRQYHQDSPQWGWQEFGVWQRFTDWMVENGLLTKTIDNSAAFTNDFLPVKP